MVLLHRLSVAALTLEMHSCLRLNKTNTVNVRNSDKSGFRTPGKCPVFKQSKFLDIVHLPDLIIYFGKCTMSNFFHIKKKFDPKMVNLVFVGKPDFRHLLAKTL